MTLGKYISKRIRNTQHNRKKTGSLTLLVQKISNSSIFDVLFAVGAYVVTQERQICLVQKFIERVQRYILNSIGGEKSKKEVLTSECLYLLYSHILQ